MLVAVYDACVLYPANLRDLLVTLAETEAFLARWTDRIHEEWIRAVMRRDGFAREKLERTRRLMDEAVDNCLVADYDRHIDGLDLPDPDDRHVLAAAIAEEANWIVTEDVGHFPAAYLWRFHVQAIRPDDFITMLWDMSPRLVPDAVREMRGRMRRPPRTAAELIGLFEKVGLGRTAARLRDVEDRV